MESKDFKDFWNNQVTPNHAHNSDEWYRRYAEEILHYLPTTGTVVDAGCGSGEVLSILAPNFNKMVAIDYSLAMLKTAEEKCNEFADRIFFYNGSITQIETACHQPADGIYCLSVIQYLSIEELTKFLKGSHHILKKGAPLVIMQIPNANCKTLFELGFYNHEKSISFYRVLRGLLSLWVKKTIYSLQHNFKPYDDGIGNWFSIEQIKQLGKANNFDVKIYGSAFVNYYYRFHAVFEKI